METTTPRPLVPPGALPQFQQAAPAMEASAPSPASPAPADPSRPQDPPEVSTTPNPARRRGGPRRLRDTAATASGVIRTLTSSPGKGTGDVDGEQDQADAGTRPTVRLPTADERRAQLGVPPAVKPDAEPAAKPDRPRLKIDQKLAVRAGVVLVGALAVLAGVAVKRSTRGQATLRKPSDAESTAIATPVARILARHVSKTERIDDLLDAADAILAAGEYMDNGPLLIPATHPGELPTFEEHR